MSFDAIGIQRTIMNDLTLRDLKTVSVSEAAATVGFKSSREFLKVWQGSGFKLIRVSERKRQVMLSDVAAFLARRLSETDNHAAA